MRSLLRWGGLRAKLLAWFLVPTAIILALVALFVINTYQRVTESLVLERNQELIQLLVSQLEGELLAYGSDLSDLARSPEIYQFDPIAQENLLRLSVGRLSDYDAGVMILDSTGTVVAADPRRTEVVGEDWSGRQYIRDMFESPRIILSDIIPDGPQGAGVVAVAAPIQGGQGVMVGMFRLQGSTETSGLQRSILGLMGTLIREGEQIYIVDSQGLVIYHSSCDCFGEDRAGEENVQRALAGEVGSVRTVSADGMEIIASFAPIGNPSFSRSTSQSNQVPRRGIRFKEQDIRWDTRRVARPGAGTISAVWGLVMEESWDELTRTSQRYGLLLLLLLTLGAIVPAAVMGLGARQITRPLVELISVAQDVAGGNLGRAISVRTGDELEELAEQFNEMSLKLQASYAHLEQRVADRTKELTALYRADEELHRYLDLERVLQALVDVAVDILQADKSSLMVWDEDRQELTVRAARGFGDETLAMMSFKPGEGTVGTVWTTGELAVVEDTHTAPDVVRQITDAEGIRSSMHVPIEIGGQIFGVFNADYCHPRGFGEEETRLFIALAQRAAMAIGNAQLYEQAQELATVRERQRLARDLHDAVSQTLFSASMIADVLPRLWERDQAEARRRLDELRQLTRGALAEMRTLLFELRPAALADVSLGDLLRQLGEAATGRGRLEVLVEVEEVWETPPDVKVALYRVAQEALNNVVKHAGASQAKVGLRLGPEGAELRVADDGRGFDPGDIPPDCLGMGIMRERVEAIGAELRIEAWVGIGAKVTVVWENPDWSGG